MGGSPPLYEKVKDLLSREDYEGRVQAEIEAWGGLLTEEAASLLVVDALGRSEVVFGRIADLYDGGEALLEAKVERVGQVRTFARRDGGEGSVVQLTVSDGSGAVHLVLRDEEVTLVTSGTVREGSQIKIVDGAVRKGRQGLEVTTGRWGVILPEVPQDATTDSSSQFRF